MAKIKGTAGNDTLVGTTGDDTIEGLGGHDILHGLEGQDTLRGSAGNDTLDGGTGHDRLTGNAGNDTLIGGDGVDDLEGGADNDTLDGGNDADALSGGGGHDLLLGGAGNDDLSGGADDDVLDGGGDNDLLSGGSGDDTVLGGNGSDSLEGGSGNDRLDGGSGDDIVEGGSGHDTLLGGGGSDTLRGGSGNDTFILDGFGGSDRVEGGSGSDTLHLNASVQGVTISSSGGGWLVAGSGGTVLVENLNTIQFTDYTYQFASGNNAPEANADSASIGEDASGVSGNVLANDIELDAVDQGTLHVTNPITQTGTYGTLSLSANGAYSYSVDTGAAQSLAAGQTVVESVTYTVSDGRGATDTGTLQVTLTGANDGPVALADAGTSHEDAIVPVTGNVLANDTDVDTGAVLSVASAGTYAGTYGTLTLNADGSYSYERTADLNGLAVGDSVNDVFAYSVQDEHGASAGADLTITITGSNDGPITVADLASADEDTVAPLTGNVLGNDTDADAGATLSVTNPGIYVGTYGTLTLNTDGSYSYERTANLDSLAIGESVSDVFSYTASDEHGAGAAADLTFHIEGANDAPVAADVTYEIGEDAPAQAFNFAGSDVDNGSYLSYEMLQSPQAGGQVSDTGDGTFVFDPAAQFEELAIGESRDATFAYRITDEYGASSEATATITVIGANDGPVASDVSYEMGEDAAAQEFAFAGSDVDNGAYLTYEVLQTPSEGILTDNGEGTFVFDPSGQFDDLALGENRDVTFAYRVHDEHGATSDATATVTIIGANDGPLAGDDGASLGEDAVAPITGNVLANDVDADHGAVLSIAAPGTYTGAYGTLTLNANGSYSYQLDAAAQSLAAGETATDTFSYTVTDEHGASATATLELAINGANDAPVAQPDSFAAVENTPFSGNVLADNGSGADSDPEGDALSVTAGTFATAQGGSVTLAADGSFTYTGAGNFAGSDSFEYTVNDGEGGSATGVVTLNVAAAPDQTIVGTAGTDTLLGGAGDDTLQGLGGDDHLDGRAGNDRLEGGSGFDRAAYNADPGVTAGISVNMASGIVTGDASIGTDTLRSIERVRGTNFADTYNATGFSGSSTNAGSNGLFNEFEGVGGNDTITGNGSTRISYFNATAGVVVNMGTGTATGDASVGTDTFTGVNAARGSDGFADTLIGSGGGDTLEGQGGDDTLLGNGGNDFFRGGAGADTIDGGSQGPGQGDIANYNGSTVGVSVNLLTGVNTGGDAEGDILIDIESLNGSSFGDTLVGNNADNPILGFGGDDTIIGNGGSDVLIGGAGADVLDGGSGNDWLSYIVSDIATGVSANLQTGVGTGGDAQGDTFTGFENLQGSQFADTLTGDDGNNQIDGQNGNDTLSGRGGNDSLMGGSGDNTLIGGTGDDWTVDASGNDTYVYAAGDGVDQVLGFAFGAGTSDRIDLTGMPGVYSLADVLARATQTQTGPNVIIDFGGGDRLELLSVDINTLHEDDFIFAPPPPPDLTLTGTAGSDSLTGGAGNDTLIGLGGDDNLDGRAGNDLLQGDSGTRDRAIYHIDPAVTAGINVAMASGIVTGNATVGTDTLRSIERVRGTNFADTYNATGFSGSSANAGSNGTFNEFEGGGGNDTITGNGATQISYNAATAGVTVNMATGTATGDSSVGTDTFTGVLSVFGSVFTDILTGSTGIDTLDGGNGDDTLDGGDGDDSLRGGQGGDAMNGGNGVDLVNYNDLNATTGVAVNLATGTGSAGHAAGDTYANVENVNGSIFADTLTGNSGANLLLGQAGNDTLAGGGGGDTLIGGLGDDRFVYNAGDGADAVFDFTAGAGSEDRVNLSGVPGIYSLADVLARASDAGASVVIDFGSGDTLQLINASVASLHADDFIFATPPVGQTLTGTAGSDTLVGGAGNDTLQGLGGDDHLEGQAGNDLLEGGSGSRDRAFYGNATGSIAVNMASGIVTGDVSVGTDTLRSVERVRGTSFADTYTATGFSGSSANAGSNGTVNEFEGAGGNDTITGNGNTRVSYFNASAGVVVNLGAGTAIGDASVGSDSFTGVSAARGSDGFGDTITGSSGNDNLEGLGGNDTISGGTGNDFILGGAGADVMSGGGHDSSSSLQRDIVSYGGSSAGVTVSLLSNTASGGDAQGDIISNFESINGSSFNDTLTGDNGQNVLQGSFGDDFLSGQGGDDWLGGGAGADFMHGGFGADWAFYTNSETGAGVSVNLGTGVATGGDAQGDTFFAVENLQGSQLFGDTLIGDGGSNFIDALGGNDTLSGGAGDNDFMQGGAGNDTFVFAAGHGADQITDFVAGAGSDDRIDLTAFASIHSLADVQAIATDFGGITQLNFGGGDTLQVNVSLSALHGDDFIFAPL